MTGLEGFAGLCVRKRSVLSIAMSERALEADLAVGWLACPNCAERRLYRSFAIRAAARGQLRLALLATLGASSETRDSTSPTPGCRPG